MNTHSPVIIEDYNPSWVKQFLEEKEKLLAVIGPYCTAIEHIGSTAVPGLAAKPVIDILIGVHHLEDAPLFIPPLEELGYEYVPEHERELPERHDLHKIVAGMHTHHLHILESDTQFYKVQLAFRDYLRAHPETAQEYETLKKALAASYFNDRIAYTDAKTPFIQRVLDRALNDATTIDSDASTNE